MIPQKISETYEGTHGKWTYRFVVAAKGCRVSRTDAARPCWSHSVLTKAYSSNTHMFVPQHVISNGSHSFKYFTSMEEAIQEIIELVVLETLTKD
jgi:hypothetical protein